jgi:DNA adenine methylase
VKAGRAGTRATANKSTLKARTKAPSVTDSPALRPALKWAGGKRWLAPRLREWYQPFRRRRLVEPFCGGLAVALALQPTRALLNDVNAHLVNFYLHLQRGLKVNITMRNEREHYLALRDEFNRLAPGRGATSAKAAQLFYYLNRTGFNGLCRFNRNGKFNVPFGSHARIPYRRDFDDFRGPLSRWRFTAGDFAALELADKDFIYADPPYDETFTQYSAQGFDFAAQQRLAEWLVLHPGPVVVSNQATERMLELYDRLDFEIMIVDAPRAISCTGDRQKAREIVATRNL